MSKSKPIRKFQGETFTVVVAETCGDYRLHIGWNAPAASPQDNVYTSLQAFELSRLLRLSASFVEWMEEYGTEAADEWSGQSGAMGGERRRGDANTRT